MTKIHRNVELANTAQKGQTGIYRNTAKPDSLLETYNRDIHTLYDAWQSIPSSAKDLQCLGYRPLLNPLTQERSSEYVWQTYGQVIERVNAFGSGIRQLIEEITGKKAGQQSPLGIWAVNRPEWTLTDLACVSFGFFSVALYDTLGDDTVRFVINHSELEAVICSANHIEHLLTIQSECPQLKLIVSMDPLTEFNNGKALVSWAKEKGITLYDFEQVEQLGRQQQRPHVPPQPSDKAFILYTSGTTGNPKGAIISHANMVAALSSVSSRFDFVFGGETVISYLPLPHVFGRIMDWTCLIHAGRIGHFSGAVELLVEDIQLLKPTLFPSVPRLLNRIYSKVSQATIHAPGNLGRIFRMALHTKIENLQQNRGTTHMVWDRLLFNKVKQVLGGNVKVIVTGSAPISSEVMDFLRVAMGAEVIEAYGSTENTGAASVSQRGEYRCGHVGAAALCTELKLVDVPEMNYLTTDPQPRGEICTRGPCTFQGYYKDEEKTRETIIDGWFHTGDVGMMDENGCLVVIDRKKNIFKLSQGEYIAPEKIENVLMNDPLVMQAFVYGDSLQSQLVAVIVPDPDELMSFAQSLHLTSNDGSTLSLASLCQHPTLVKKVFQHLTKVVKQSGLKGFEQPKAICLEATPFSIDTGILTPTMKLKRPEAKQRYLQHIQSMYDYLAKETPKALL
ncbi:uncharacterized protein BX664DRAFT_282240 [Halteromyces radiatus]|uniref:uncharacterized protein n=1 Tax=Halteromyces radiatus TaxID=101107 RepID=UPI00222038C7|nr:uncharacterized protein BX664DRAFT_282240 [Halteromyces radiatus]KAI8086370.1 hypothetical protein BX664DRAFT_282240 [Halteromyces radiatus]